MNDHGLTDSISRAELRTYIALVLLVPMEMRQIASTSLNHALYIM